WKVLETRETMVGEIPVVETQLQGQVDNASCPAIEVNISMTLATPKNAEAPVPVLMMYGFGFGPGRGAPPRTGQPPAAPPIAAGAPPPRRFGPPGPSRTEALIK